MRLTRRRVFTLAQWVLAAAFVVYAVRAIGDQWGRAAARLGDADLSWMLIATATAIVFATFVLLIDAWRQIVIASGETLRFADAARIWFVSNLGKYVPGKVWALAAMTMMARDSGVAPITAAGSSLLIQLVSVATGIGIVLVTGAQAVDEPVIAAAAGVVLIAGLAALPRLLPALGRAAGSLVGRTIEVPVMTARTVWEAVVRSAIAWIAYGIAFRIFVAGTLGSAAGATTSYIAVYVASYIIGFLALFAPGGAVVRESAMIAGMLRLGLSDQADALAVAVATRLWLTATELLPGLVYLALGRRAARTE